MFPKVHFLLPSSLIDMFDFSYIQEKAEIFARGFLGEAEAGNLSSGAPVGGEDGASGHGEGEDGGVQAEDAPKTSEV